MVHIFRLEPIVLESSQRICTQIWSEISDSHGRLGCTCSVLHSEQDLVVGEEVMQYLSRNERCSVNKNIDWTSISMIFTKMIMTMGWIHIWQPNQLTHQVHMPLQLLWQQYGLISFWYLWRVGISFLFHSALLSLEKPKLPLLHRPLWMKILSKNFNLPYLQTQLMFEE